MMNSSDDPGFIEKRAADLFSEPVKSASVSKALTAPRATPLAVAAPHPAFELSDRQAEASFQQLMNVIGRHRWKLAIFMICALGAIAGVTEMLTPLYESRVAVNVERRGTGSVVGEQTSLPSAGEMDQILTTQIELIESDPVLRPATEKYHLLDLEKQFSWLNDAEKKRLPHSRIVLKRLKVTRAPNTSVIRITYKAADPKLAADVVTMIVKSYIEHAFDVRELSNAAVSNVVNRQLADLSRRMAASDAALAAFAKDLNFIDPEQRINILSARLLQLSSDYTAAQSDRLHKEALARATKSGSLASAQISAQGSLLEAALTRLNQSKNEFTRVSTVFGENHAEYQKALRERDEMQRQFDEVRNNTVERIAVDYRQTLEHEQMAHDLLAETRSEVDGLTAKAFEYQRLKNEAANYRKLYDDLERITREQVINRSFQDAVIQVVDPARPSAKQVFPSMPLNLIAGFFLSGMVGIGAIVLLDSLDGRVRSPEDAVKLPDVDVIAALPRFQNSRKKSGRVVAIMPKNRRTKLLLEYQESIRALRNSMIALMTDRALRSLVITSPSAYEDASNIVSNLAFSYAMLGRKVLLIDANLREPALHRMFEKEGTVGLADVVAGKKTWQEPLVKVAREELYLLPAGLMTESSSDLISTRMPSLLDDIYAEFELVLIVTPPVLAAPEAVPLATSAEGVLVLSRARSTAAKDISAAYAALRRARANIVGMVMTDVDGLAKPKIFREAPGITARAS